VRQQVHLRAGQCRGAVHERQPFGFDGQPQATQSFDRCGLGRRDTCSFQVAARARDDTKHLPFAVRPEERAGISAAFDAQKYALAQLRVDDGVAGGELATAPVCGMRRVGGSRRCLVVDFIAL